MGDIMIMTGTIVSIPAYGGCYGPAMVAMGLQYCLSAVTRPLELTLCAYIMCTRVPPAGVTCQPFCDVPYHLLCNSAVL